jgi:predicted dehydrogenase
LLFRKQLKVQIIKQPLNLVFLGCGFATRLHSKTLSKFGTEVRRFYASRDAAKAAEYNRKFGGSGMFESYEAAIQANEIDVVLVATPPARHLEQTLSALQAGKHVIVEKPPFLHASDFATVRQAAKEAGKEVFVAENYFYKPLAIKLRELIRSEVIGEPLFLHVNALKEQRIKDWRADVSLSGGGALFEGGIHWINFIANLGWGIQSVSGYRPGGTTEFEKSILVNIKYADGPVGTLYYSWETPSLFKGLRLSKIYGRAGSITFESNGVFVFMRGKKKGLMFPGFADIAGYQAMFADFIKSIREDVEPQFTLDLAERDLKLIETIYKNL